MEECIDVIVISGRANSGKSTLAQFAKDFGYEEIDISEFLAEIVRYKFGLYKRDFNKEEFRGEINKIGKEIDLILPVYVVNKIKLGGKYVIPSVKNSSQLQKIKNWAKIENKPLNVRTILIKREKSFDDGIREELETPDFIINNKGDLTDLYIKFKSIITWKKQFR
jgi:dephospho-CoA kinase